MADNEVMDTETLIAILREIYKNYGNYEVWLSKDDEGNEFLRMSKDASISLAIDSKQNRIILFPSWYFPNLKQ